MKDWTEEIALASSSKWVDMNYNGSRLLGYFSYSAANFLVSTGKYTIFNVHVWGYVLMQK